MGARLIGMTIADMETTRLALMDAITAEFGPPRWRRTSYGAPITEWGNDDRFAGCVNVGVAVPMIYLTGADGVFRTVSVVAEAEDVARYPNTVTIPVAVEMARAVLTAK